ncbi:hypothetical protein [Streptomyces sp. NPDC020951]|uniref:hypothetical protein n=1 Tax=Streptomyces sp. NPDC020951 TaxID=3365104 RepID=UPI00378CDD44
MSFVELHDAGAAMERPATRSDAHGVVDHLAAQPPLDQLHVSQALDAHVRSKAQPPAGWKTDEGRIIEVAAVKSPCRAPQKL